MAEEVGVTPKLQMKSGPVLDDLRVAIVHDYLVERGGAERVALELLNIFPQATLYTALYRPDATYDELRQYDIRSLLPDGSLLTRNHRATLPLALERFARLRTDADLLICSSSGLAHLARNPAGPKLVYCHTPARWLHRPDQYFKGFPPLARRVGHAVGGLNHRRDRARMQQSDKVVVNAKVIRNEVHKVYDVEAQIIHPVSSLEIPGPETAMDIEPGFFLTPCRLLGYKRIDLVNAVARRLPEQQFVVAGEGPMGEQLRASAPSNVRFVGLVDDDQLRWLYRSCRGVLLTCAEDFGLVPAEAGAYGRVSVVPDARGFRDTEDGHESIHTYQFGDVSSMTEALQTVNGEASDPLFDIARLKKEFRRQIVDVVSDLVAVP